MVTMKAYRLHAYGGSENLKLDDIPVPLPGKSQVRVTSNIVAMNPFDWKIREGYVKDAMPLPLPVTLGADFVGTVSALGDGATKFKIRDRVMTISQALGAFAEEVIVDESILARIPEGLGDAKAATVPMPALTAKQTLETAGEVEAGMKVLVHGASGVVGAYAVQFAKAAGAYVIGTASEKNREYVLDLGTDQFIDYQTQNFEDEVHDIDLVLDYVLIGGAKNTTDRSWGVLRPNGAIVTAADPMILSKIPDGYRGYFRRTQPDVKCMEDVAEQLVDGKLKTRVAKVYPREQLVEAMEINKAGGTVDRLLVDFRR